MAAQFILAARTACHRSGGNASPHQRHGVVWFTSPQVGQTALVTNASTGWPQRSQRHAGPAGGLSPQPGQAYSSCRGTRRIASIRLADFSPASDCITKNAAIRRIQKLCTHRNIPPASATAPTMPTIDAA